MKPNAVAPLVVVAILALPVTGYGQEAMLTGTITDTLGGLLPGVVVTAVHEASGNTFETATDETGAYRLSVRTGVYRVAAELAGFTPATRVGLELLVGQRAVVNIQMSPAAVQETVTVTGEAPLIDATQSRMGGNIDPRQLSELPVNGRNWTDLTMLAPGSRANNATDGVPVPTQNSARAGNARGAYQLNVDGQQVTTIISAGTIGQPNYSRDAISEFEFVSNRFDATQGRSSGVQVNVVTKSGTNRPAGSLSGYFRDDRFNAADFIQQRVLPYSNQQVSGTFGGPLRRDRIHFFAHYEYEREPQTFTYSSRFPRFNIDQSSIREEHKGGVRLDFQFSPQTRLAVRGSTWTHLQPFVNAGGAAVHPSTATGNNRKMRQLHLTFTQVLGNRAVNVVRGGYAGYQWRSEPKLKPWPGSPLSSLPWATPGVDGSVTISLLGYSIGSSGAQVNGQGPTSVRNDLTYSFTKAGRHELKVGGEYIYNMIYVHWCNVCTGVIDATGGPIPANIEDLFPAWNDVTTWNLAALSPITIRYRQNFGTFQTYSPRHVYATWVQDDWTITPRLTLNLGLRYDLTTGAIAEKIVLQPFLSGNRSSDTNNIGPRIGFAFSANDRTVIRGGFGTYFAELPNISTHWSRAWSQQIIPETPNDGRPDFAANPYNGPPPTYDEALQLVQARGQRREITGFLTSPDYQNPYSYQTSIGIQRQVGDTVAIEADYVYSGGRHEPFQRNINLSYDRATGLNYPFTDISRRPYPDFGVVVMDLTEGRSNYHALQTGFTKRLSQRWQASGTYTLSGTWDGTASPAPFAVARDLGGEYSLAATDQRHRAVLNGIWQLGYGFQLSGLYFYGSGERYPTRYGGDRRNTGGATLAGEEGRLRPDGTIVPRNNFVGKAIHRVDLRVQRRFQLGSRVGIDGIFETFNLFNHANYGSYVTQESARNYGQPSNNQNVAYRPRMLQLGFRVAF